MQLPHIAHEILHCNCASPFSFLGPQTLDTDTLDVNLYLPFATSVKLLDASGEKVFAEAVHLDGGLFKASIKPSEMQYPYQVRVIYKNNDQNECAEHSGSDESQEHEHCYFDPYQFTSEAYHAVHFIDHAPENIYQQAGAQLVSAKVNSNVKDTIDGVRFAVFAPNASAVSVIGDFNAWNRAQHPMQKTDMGYWVLFIPGIGAGAKYKYAIKDMHGHSLADKSDPIGFQQEQYPSHASVVFDHGAYQWNDAKWFEHKGKCDEEVRSRAYHQPMSIYEVHLGSWKRPDSPEHEYLNYHQLADELVDYAKSMSYTHIEVLPVSEFPFDGSWGYQPVGLFAPTSRFGDADDFKYFVDQCHQQGIGVIIDWVPAHFPEDPHGLAKFDGTHVYEYEDPRKGWHPDWNSCIYDFGKDTVRQFLVGNALYWFDKFHVDAIRVDAVASMLYLDYSRNHGEWIPNVDGSNHNYEAISLLQWMNTEVYKHYPHALTIAEESTSFAGVSRPVSNGGLGFGFKWNMGWMHDSLSYIEKDPAYRKYHHGELTFSMVYAYDENFVLPISHDEVVHGKGSMLEKMPGDEWQKFANLRAFYGFMFGHPGKKLQFMGNEFAQPNEWNHDAQLRWDVLNHPMHAGIHQLYRDLNKAYCERTALHQLDHQQAGFRWGDLHNSEQSIVSFVRSDEENQQSVLVVCNFTPVPHDNMRFGVSKAGQYKTIINTDEADYGGSGYPCDRVVNSEDTGFHDMSYSVAINVPPLCTIMFVCE
ncbi:1,4-alpha-glucan branching protein GlgB [Ningiella sp. W23]|uniref:1,4-alpha-glucan branching protein GlgB n=1 Tax=Ningiella sp. W23 TaxID=3023715 RepID=UPI003756E775